MSKLWYLIRTASVKQGYKLCRGAGGGGEEDKPTEFSKQERIFEQAAFLWLSTEIWEQGRGNDVLIRYETGLWAAFCITLAKRGGEGSPKVADQSVQAAVCVWAAAKGGTQVKQGGFKWARLPLQKMQRSLKGSMLKWVAYVLIFKDRKRCTRLHLSASISLALP